MSVAAPGAPPPAEAGVPEPRAPFPSGWLLLTLVTLLGALLVAELVVYQRLILPRQTGPGGVPAWWWAGVLAPPIGVLLASGARLRSWRHAVGFAWAASAVSVAFDYARTVGAPGTVPAAATPPLFFWVFGLGVRWVLYGLVLAAGMLLGALVRRHA